MRPYRKRSAAAIAAAILLAAAPLAHAAVREPSAPSAQETEAAQQAGAPQQAKITAQRPAFPAALPCAVNEKAVRAVAFRLTRAYDTPRAPRPSMQATILGEPQATPEQMAAFIERRSPSPKLSCSVREIVAFYYEEGAREGIRGDLALCQALKETGFFSYGGDVSPAQNNFCGLGATGSHEPGASFATPRLGVRAHIQHLKAYASEAPPTTALVDPRYTLLRANRPDVFGKIKKWRELNGAWAVPGKSYGEQILALLAEAERPDASDRSLAAAEARVQRTPNDPAAYQYRGSAYYARGDYANALADFEQAADGKSPGADALFDRALAEEKTGNPQKAEKTYAHLLAEAAPHDQAARYNRARLLCIARKYDAAIRELDALLAESPDDAIAQNALAFACIGKKDYAAAWSALGKAAGKQPANMDILANQFILEACLLSH